MSDLINDLQTLWAHVDTCECPAWAMPDDVQGALERVSRFVTSTLSGEILNSPHRCLTTDAGWVPCPANLCEADKLAERQ